jgi:hypothetical protein
MSTSTLTLDQTTLEGFIGSETFTRYSPLFPRICLSEGALYVAETAGAYWLMDVIGSHQPQALRHPRLQEIQFWTLTVKDHKGLVICQPDSGEKPVIRQRIPYTDFPLPEIKLWVAPAGDGRHYNLFLPSEY